MQNTYCEIYVGLYAPGSNVTETKECMPSFALSLYRSLSHTHSLSLFLSCLFAYCYLARLFGRSDCRAYLMEIINTIARTMAKYNKYYK